MKTQWGRNERLVWAPHLPIYSYMAVAGALLCAALFIWESYAFQQPLIRKAYTTEYIRASVGAQLNQHGKYRLLVIGGDKRPTRPALPADFTKGTTFLPGGASVPVMLSPDARAMGYSYFQRAPAKSYGDASMYRWLRGGIFGGRSLVGAYAWPLGESLFVLVAALALAVPADVRRLKELKYGRLLRGPVMLTPKQFNKTLKSAGLGVTTDEKDVVVRIPEKDEAKHIQVMGDTGTGKSTLLYGFLTQIQERGEAAIVYDPAGEFIKRFFNADRGDVILNPMDARCPYWSPSDELQSPAEARTIAASLYQPTSKQKGEFFVESPQKIFARLLQYRPSPHQLAAWMADEDEIDRRVEGTPMKSLIAKGAQQQRSGVLGSLGLVADGLALLPAKDEAARTWSATEWSEKREGWIFLSSKKSEREAIRPLHSLWIDLLFLRLGELPEEGQKRAWFVLDEIASLQRLPQFHTALTENRKSNNPIIFGYQGRAQMEYTYDKLAEVMLSQSATKYVMKTSEPEAAKWASQLLGDIEIERMKETHVHGSREGKSFTIDRQIEPLVMDSEIKGLADLHAFVKLGNLVSRFTFPHSDLPIIAPGFIPRESGSQMEWLELPDAPVAPAVPASVVLPQDKADSHPKKTRRKPRGEKAADPATEPASSSAEASVAEAPADEPMPAPVPEAAPEASISTEPLPAAIVSPPPVSLDSMEHL